MIFKKISIIILFSFFICSNIVSQNIEYSKALAKTYGIIRYFQPTKTSQQLDWESLAIYSAYEISKAKTKQELVGALQQVFYPISPYIIIDFIPNTVLPAYQKKNFSYYKHTGAGLDAYIPNNVPKEYKPYFSEIITKNVDSLDKNLSQTIHQEIAEGIFLHYSVCIPTEKEPTKEGKKVFETFNKKIKTFHKKEFRKVAKIKHIRKYKRNPFFPSFYQVGYVVQLWNIAYYFNPYLDKKVWEIALEKYLKTALASEYLLNHYENLQIMASDMNDSHARAISSMLTTMPLVAFGISKSSPLIYTKLVEGKIMVDVSEDKFVKKGDVIKQINGKTIDELTNQKLMYAVGASQKAKMNNAGSRFLEEISARATDTLTIGRFNQQDTTVILKTQKNIFLLKPKNEQPFIKNLNNNICYIDVCDRRFSMEKAKAFIIANKDAKGFIFDVRSYPNFSSDELLAFFSTKPLEGLEMVTPVITSPMLANDTLSTTETAIYKVESIQSKAKVVCLSSSYTYSYPETWLGTVKKNKIGIIIGEATAGTNGDVVMVNNTKIFGLWFTGLIVKMNGQRTHGIGILPDIEISPTIDGIRKGKDEVLERAIEYLNNNK